MENLSLAVYAGVYTGVAIFVIGFSIIWLKDRIDQRRYCKVRDQLMRENRQEHVRNAWNQAKVKDLYYGVQLTSDQAEELMGESVMEIYPGHGWTEEEIADMEAGYETVEFSAPSRPGNWMSPGDWLSS
jgi:hypothetical protein